VVIKCIATKVYNGREADFGPQVRHPQFKPKQTVIVAGLEKGQASASRPFLAIWRCHLLSRSINFKRATIYP